MTSNSPARRATHSSMAVSAEVGSIGGRLSRSGLGDMGTSSAFVFEPPLAIAQTHQLVGQPGNDAFCSAIMARGHAFGERRNFCNVHSYPKCEWLRASFETTSSRAEVPNNVQIWECGRSCVTPAVSFWRSRPRWPPCAAPFRHAGARPCGRRLAARPCFRSPADRTRR